MKHFDRLIMCAFVFVNGCPPLVFYEWCELIGCLRDNSAWHHVKYLLEKDFPKKQENYQDDVTPPGGMLYAFCIHQNHYRYVDGRVRIYEHKSIRDKKVSLSIIQNCILSIYLD